MVTTGITVPVVTWHLCYTYAWILNYSLFSSSFSLKFWYFFDGKLSLTRLLRLISLAQWTTKLPFSLRAKFTCSRQLDLGFLLPCNSLFKTSRQYRKGKTGPTNHPDRTVEWEVEGREEPMRRAPVLKKVLSKSKPLNATDNKGKPRLNSAVVNSAKFHLTTMKSYF